MKVRRMLYCICQSALRVKRKYIFGLKIKKRWKQLLKNKIKLYWEDDEGKEQSMIIPIDSYVKICDDCANIIKPNNNNKFTVKDAIGGKIKIKNKNGQKDTKNL